MEHEVDYKPLDPESFESHLQRMSSQYGISTIHARCWIANYKCMDVCAGCEGIDICGRIHKDEFGSPLREE